MLVRLWWEWGFEQRCAVASPDSVVSRNRTFSTQKQPHARCLQVLESLPAQLTFRGVHPRPNLVRSQLEPQTIHKSLNLVITSKNADKALGGHIHKLKFFIHSGGQEKIPQCWKWSTMIPFNVIYHLQHCATSPGAYSAHQHMEEEEMH